jgi:hypothetical protein
MIAPVRNAYAQRVAGSRVAAGARNVAKTSDTPNIETTAPSKRTGAQEESLLREGAEGLEAALAADNGEGTSKPRQRRRRSDEFTDMVDGSLAWTARVRAAAEAYRYTIEKLDKSERRLSPGDIYDAPS